MACSQTSDIAVSATEVVVPHKVVVYSVNPMEQKSANYIVDAKAILNYVLDISVKPTQCNSIFFQKNLAQSVMIFQSMWFSYQKIACPCTRAEIYSFQEKN
jgi:hypothetical protein